MHSIAGQYRGMHDVFLQNSKSSQYACNVTLINGTDVLRSFYAVIREFCFLLGIELLQTPTNLNQGNSGMYEYLQHVLNNYQSTTSILQIFVEEQWTAHRERCNQN